MGDIKEENSEILQKEAEEAFYSSLDSDSENESRPRDIGRLVSRKSVFTFNNLKINKEDFFRRLNRRELVEKINEMHRMNIKYEHEINSSKITWQLVFQLLFVGYFNFLKERKGGTILLTNNKKKYYDYIFNLREIELRIKNFVGKLKGKQYADAERQQNEGNHINEVKNIDSNRTVLRTRWTDFSLNTILRMQSATKEEKNSYVPKFISTFENTIDYEMKKRLSKKKAKKKFQIIQERNKNKIATTQVKKSEAQEELRQINKLFKKTTTLERPEIPQFRFQHSQTIKEVSMPINYEKERVETESSTQGTTGGNPNVITMEPIQLREGGNKVNKYITLFNTNKNILSKMIRKYPQYESEMLNLKNNFMTYDIELNKHESLFKNPMNAVGRHLFDFHYVSELHKNAKSLNKKYVIKERIIHHARVVDEFLQTFQKVMSDSKMNQLMNTYEY